MFLPCINKSDDDNDDDDDDDDDDDNNKLTQEPITRSVQLT